MGHIFRDCRSRLAGEKQATPSPSHVPTPAVTPAVSKPEKKPICFNCRQVGHKSLQCPKKQAANSVKRIQIPLSKVKMLKQGEVLAAILGQAIPVTIDSGAEITIVPEECA